MITRRAFALGAVTAAAATAQVKIGPNADGHELIGNKAPALNLAHWINSKPLDMADLRGKVVLLRWWTEGCDLCTATGPALKQLQAAYGNKGLQVIGVYHPKPKGSWTQAQAQQAVDEKRFDFPVAIDGDWTALKRWWLNGHRAFTSVSFLVDQQGIIRYVQPGGEYHEGDQGAFSQHESCNRDYHAIRAEIERLLNTSVA